uniref:Terminase large subunit n=1 Tax=Stenotrophomonas phage vB_SmaS_QH3 TaxID=3229738 RepID=A0AAU7YTE7_9CAUD
MPALAIKQPVAPPLALQPAPQLEVVFKPLPGSQTIALCSMATHTLYEGARGPGKTLTQLMRFYRNVGKGYGKFWRGVIFDLEFDHLGGLVAESKKWFGENGKLKDGAKFLESPSQYKWVWPTGEELLFRHVKKLSDYEGFHGHEYPFLGWNELTKHASGELYDKFMSVNRVTFDPVKDTPKDPKTGRYLTSDGLPLPPIKCEVFSTTNPSGPGHNWVKKRFITIAPRGTVVRRAIQIYNPATEKEETHVITQIAIFGSYKENPYLPASYIAELESIKEPNLRKAWLYGDWDVTAGGAIDDLWDSQVHVVPRFVVPSSWRLDRTYDDGSSHPFSVGWWAEADGTEATVVLTDGTEYTFCPQPGSLIQIFEWYGCAKDEKGEFIPNTGLKMSASNIAQGIIDREISMMANGWIPSQPWPGPADNRIRQVIDVELDTTEKLMSKKGVRWLESDKSPGSRVIGLQLLRDRLEASIKREGPGIYFMSNCVASIELLPTLPRDEKKIDDVDTSAEDHTYDMTRYRVLKGANKTATKVKVSMPT